MNTKTKSLFGYILPALGGSFVTYLYNVVDGIFVGQGVGPAALGAVNIGVPSQPCSPWAEQRLSLSEWAERIKTAQITPL